MKKSLVLSPAMQKRLRALPEAERVGAVLALLELVAAFGNPHVPSGIGIRKLRASIFECRAGLANRFAFQDVGDVLVVGLNGDDSVRQLKGEGRPVNREQDRAEVLAALESVDYVTIFPENRATNFLRAAAPAVYAKGGDYTADTLDPGERAVLDEFGTRIEIIPFEKGYSTSELLTRIGQK